MLTGARQTGKSSLLKHELPKADYVTLDYVTVAEEAETNPSAFLARFDSQVVLDEIQYAPSLFRDLKILVDQNRTTFGKWVLTGSQKFVLMKNVSESLAGRIAILHLETCSAKELRDSGHFDFSQIEDILWKGGYPELWANPDLDPVDYFQNYVQTYLSRDLTDIINVKNLRDFQRFIRLCATRAGSLINYTDISGNVGVSAHTIKSWVSALEIAGLVYLVPPYYANIGKRLIKSPKLYFADPGLLSFLLNLNSLEAWNSNPYKGQLWENFAFTELVKSGLFSPGNNLFYYRDHNGVEIDFLLETDGQTILVEAKAAERIDERKLNFAKVAPILASSKCILLNPIQESRPVLSKNYVMANPLKTDLDQLV